MYQDKYHKVELNQFSFLVTGGAGFIGSHLIEYLLLHGAKKVRVLDNFSTGNRKNIEQFESNPSFELIEGDIRDVDTCNNVCQNIDYIFHNAALGSVPRSINDPKTSNDVNITGFLNILNAAREHSVEKLVYASSSSAYGNSRELPKIEERIGLPLSPYAVTKHTNELYANVFSSIYGMKMIGLRYFNVFGPRQNPNGDYAAVIPKFVNLLLEQKSPQINGDGTYSRDFTFVENVVQMNIKAAFSEQKEGTHEAYNTACADRTTLLELIDYIKDCIGDETVSTVEPVFGELRQGDVPHSLASIDKARANLGYNPLFTVKKGLGITVEWYKNNVKSL